MNILLTGAAGGIGLATARALLAKGHRLALVDREAEALSVALAELRSIGACVEGEPADVTDRDGLHLAICNLEGKIGPVDVVVACAGVGGLSSAIDLDTAGLRRMLEVNVLGVAHTIEAVLPGMYARGSGHLVGISSVAGYRGLPWMPGYSASKAAISTYLEGLRPALKRRGVTITTVCPGFVRTALTAGTPFRKPVPMMEPDDAARYIVRAIERRPRNYVFPLSTAMGMAFLRGMPDFAYDWMMDRAGPRALTTEF